MTNRIAKTMIFFAVAAFVLATVPAAHAAGPCVREAKRDYKDCGAACKEAYQTDKDACLNRDHACVEVCRANRSQCRLDTGFDANIDICNNTLEAARAVCLANPPPSGMTRDQCIDQAQIDAFRCRDAERERAKPLLKNCRSDFRTCVNKPECALPPLATPVNVGQCIHTAKDAAKICDGTCKEEFQFAKDTCRGRDHACVENCRALRNTCRQPFRTQLESDLARCATNRQTGIDDCNNRQPPLSPAELNTCIDGVQVAAFICRDQANEDAQGTPPALGFRQCRLEFRTCVRDNCPCVLTNCPVVP